jgi:membrane associated rhomboid family serine protease
VNLVENARECPATYGLAATWVLVYALMVWHQGGFHGDEISIVGFGRIQNETTHVFGDATWRDVSNGQVWRLITSTFIHYSLAHLVINLIGLIQLGMLMENWYGARQFLAICLGLGGMGNLLGVLMRQGVANGRVWLQAHGLARVFPPGFFNGGAPQVLAQIPSAGGSTVILGLIGLALVVGWRSKTRVGAFLRDQMLGFLAFTAVIGFFGRQVIDNYGHAGGAISGACLGFFHRKLVHTPERGRFRWFAGAFSLLTVSLCLMGAVYAAHAETLEARRLAEVKEAVVRANISEELRSRLRSLDDPTEQLAFEMSVPVIFEALVRGDPPSSGTIDTGIVAERLLMPNRPVVPSKQLLPLVRQRLLDLAAVRPHLDPDLAGSEYDEVIRLVEDLLRGPLDSRRLFEFRLALTTLERRAVEARDKSLARAEALGVKIERGH